MTRDERRKLMPITAAWLDEMRSLFGDPVYIHARENGHEVTWGVKS